MMTRATTRRQAWQRGSSFGGILSLDGGTANAFFPSECRVERPKSAVISFVVYMYRKQGPLESGKATGWVLLREW